MTNIYKAVRIDNMDTDIFSAIYRKDGVAADIENGSFVTIKSLIDGERELYYAEDVVEADTMVGLVCTPEFEYDERGYHGIETFINKANRPIRIKLLEKGAEFSITGVEYTKDQEISVGTFKIVCEKIEQVGRLKYFMMRVL